MRLFFAAGESDISKGVGYVFEPDSGLFLSYFYREKVATSLPVLDASHHRGLRIIDSGAFSYLAASGLVSTGSQRGGNAGKFPEVRQFFSDYLQWLRKWYAHFDYFVEMDLQEVYGPELIEEFRDEIRKSGMDEKCIYTFHSGDSWETLDRLISSSPSRYIGLQGIRLGQKPLDYLKVIRMCYEAKVKVHGFAFTKDRLLSWLPFYSVDSSSWVNGARFGCVTHFHGMGLSQFRNSKTVTLEELDRRGLPRKTHPSLVGPGARFLRLKQAEIEYLKFQEYVTRLWESRGVVWED